MATKRGGKRRQLESLELQKLLANMTHTKGTPLQLGLICPFKVFCGYSGLLVCHHQPIVGLSL